MFNLSFSVESRFRPFHLVAPGFTEVADAPGAVTGLSVGGDPPAAPFAAVELDVAAVFGTVVAGLATAGDEHLLGFYDSSAGRAGIEVRRGGETRILAATEARLPSSFGFAVALCENRVTVLADTGAGWQPLLTERAKVSQVVDMRQPETLAAHRYAWGVAGTSGSAELGGVRAGLFGMTGIRDLHLVQHADGSPYVREGKAYLTATCAGLGFFQQAHWGVFTLDLSAPTRLEQVAQLYSRRDGLLLGDHAGQVVRDDENDRWLIATSSWGDFAFDGVHVRHAVTTDDVLSGVHVLETDRTPLPTAVSSWDPGMTRVDGRWHIGFVESPSQKPFDFHPALAAGREGADWLDDLKLVGAATDLHQTEGPVIARVEDRWWLLASDGDHRRYPVFDLNMEPVGGLDAPYGSNIPHPQLVPLPDDRGGPVGPGAGGPRSGGASGSGGSGGGFLLLTFDGTQYAENVMGYGGHGDVVVMRSGPRRPARRLHGLRSWLRGHRR